MIIDIDMTYEEFLWICKMAIKCENAGLKIKKVQRDSENNEVSLILQAIVLGEENDR